jgi:hypothetical protein
MSPSDQGAYRGQLEARMKADFNEFAHSMATKEYKSTFGAFDAVFFLLALVTAFKVGSGMSGDD